MALMFARLAHNFARNGYYPTDETTLERALLALAPSPNGKMRIFDPCAGEGAALAETAHALGRDRVEAYAVEYDQERAEHCKNLLLGIEARGGRPSSGPILFVRRSGL